MAEKTYTVQEVVSKISSALTELFPNEIWVEGTIRGYSVARSGHTYFDLCQGVENPSDTPKFIIPVALFKNSRDRMAGQIKMEAGLEVRIRGRTAIYGPTGKVQIIMSDIDEHYTISKLAYNRELLLANLRTENLLDLNKQLPVKRLPLKVALVTSKGSAAHKDFEAELKKSGYSWELSLIHTSVQGETAPDEICAALKTAATLGADVVALIRGGGSQLDLTAFDSEVVARTVAKMPLPVFCGIGHETDSSIVDVVVHTSTKTPTACARTLVDLVTTAANELDDMCENIFEKTKQILKDRHNALRHYSSKLAHAPTELLTTSREELASIQVGLKIHTRQILSNALSYIKDQNENINNSIKEVLSDALGTLNNHNENINNAVEKKISDAWASIGSLKKQIGILDPQNFLKRGWSITKTEDGKPVKDAKKVPAGTQLLTKVAKGEIRSTSN